MLVELTLENFRCFGKHTIPLRPKTIIVGRNNAGKSTIVEALRLVAIVAERYRGLTYNSPPKWLDLPKVTRGVSPSLNGQAFNFEKVFHRYNDPPAIVKARFNNSTMIEVYIGPDNSIYSVLRGPKRQPINSKGAAIALELPSIGILPQVGPLRNIESVLDPQYVKDCMTSTLAPKHFRNQLSLYRAEYFAEFKQIAEDTWHGLRIEELVKARRRQESVIELMVRNDDFVAEVSWMGHGLQMWLQTMWFLARCRECATVILDEPDVYMHADLQRKLIQFVQNRHQQVIVATHSVEIMAEVEPEDILVVDKERREAKFASDLPEVQQIITHIGAVHNLQLARLVSSAKCLFVEGDDLDILRRFYNRLFPKSSRAIETVPNVSIGGWGGWNNVVGSTLWIGKTTSEVSIFCFLDSDYYTASQKSERLEQAEKKNIRLKIWNRKELENYLLVPSAIQRALGRSRASAVPTVDDIRSKMDELAEGMKQHVTDCIAEQIKLEDKALSLKSANEQARERVSTQWGTFDRKMGIIPGKDLLSELNKWMQAKFKISFTTTRLAADLTRDEIAEEIKDALTAFESNESF